jgi:hypothetical protein
MPRKGADAHHPLREGREDGGLRASTAAASLTGKSEPEESGRVNRIVGIETEYGCLAGDAPVVEIGGRAGEESPFPKAEGGGA